MLGQEAEQVAEAADLLSLGHAHLDELLPGLMPAVGGSEISSLDSGELASEMTSRSWPLRTILPSSSRETPSQISRTTDISWVMMTTVIPSRSRSSRMS